MQLGTRRDAARDIDATHDIDATDDEAIVIRLETA